MPLDQQGRGEVVIFSTKDGLVVVRAEAGTVWLSQAWAGLPSWPGRCRVPTSHGPPSALLWQRLDARTRHDAARVNGRNTGTRLAPDKVKKKALRTEGR